MISTIASAGSSGYSGDGGTAVRAQIGYPYHLAIDVKGVIYIADSQNVIRFLQPVGPSVFPTVGH